MNYEEAVTYILDIPKFTAKNSLDHTREFLRRLGEPGKDKKIIHVAGTNGKGSVCAYLQALLLCEQKRVGFFTSPHLVTMNERISVNRELISEDMFLHIFHIVLEIVRQMEADGLHHPTFFEFLFGMAMYTFEKADVEYIILETGLGGRLDATNAILHPALTIITSISLDHTDILGDTIEKIAAEKAGIMKKGVPLIFDANNRASRSILLQRAGELDIPCREIAKNAYEIKEIKDKYIAFSSVSAYYEDITWCLSNTGIYQAENALLALEAMQFLCGEEKHLEKWKEALKEVKWAGRMEEIADGVFLDGAHNLGAIQAFTESVNAIETDRKGKTVVLFSAVKEKEYEKMIAHLCRNFKADLVVLTEIDDERAVDAAEMASIFRRHTDTNIIVMRAAPGAYEYAVREKGKDGRLYCLGSLYLVGMLKAYLEKECAPDHSDTVLRSALE